jgi:2,4-dienoyl-CoA reductase-like NADH-dependent reductase (Old Yellow Enzyme family)
MKPAGAFTVSVREMAQLFNPLKLRDVTLRNRMCEYSSPDGFATDWHLVHLGSRAVGGAGLVLTEATAVEPEGRISPQDLGLWRDEHIEKLSQIAQFVQDRGAVAGVQLAHAGRKASTAPPWLGGGPVAPEEGGWRPIYAPSALAFQDGGIVPDALDGAGITRITAAFVAAAGRALAAGFQVIELHAAHGYLLHSFLSPLANQRTDAYGGSFENRTRFLLDVVREVRRIWPERLPLFVRVSASDWLAGGWTLDESVELARLLGPLGIDLMDCSSGGIVPKAPIALGPGYQVPFAERVKRESGLPTGAVGMITEARQAEAILTEGKADIVLLARELLREPYWPLHAALEFGVDIAWPQQYERAKPPLAAAAGPSARSANGPAPAVSATPTEAAPAAATSPTVAPAAAGR